MERYEVNRTASAGVNNFMQEAKAKANLNTVNQRGKFVVSI